MEAQGSGKNWEEKEKSLLLVLSLSFPMVSLSSQNKTFNPQKARYDGNDCLYKEMERAKRGQRVNVLSLRDRI